MSSKGIAIFSVDTGVIELFKLKFPSGTRSNLIENFMKDVCLVADQVVDHVDSHKLKGMIEEARVKKHEAALHLNTLEVQLKEAEERSKRDQRERDEEAQRQIDVLSFEGKAMEEAAREKARRLGY